MERLDMYSLDSSSEEEKVRSDSKADHKENTDSRKAERGKVLINTKRLTRRVNFHHEKSAANNDKSQFERQQSINRYLQFTDVNGQNSQEWSAKAERFGERVQNLNNYLQTKCEPSQQEHVYKSYEKHYLDYLAKAEGSQKQVNVFDSKEDLLVPSTIDKRKRHEFYTDLIESRKIDHYEVKITPILYQMQESSEDEWFINRYTEDLHPETFKLIKKSNNVDYSSQGSNLANDDPNKNNIHSIFRIDVDHFSFNTQNQFMVVKTIEEMQFKKNEFVVIQTLRIYKEVLNEQTSNKQRSNIIDLNKVGAKSMGKKRSSILFDFQTNLKQLLTKDRAINFQEDDFKMEKKNQFQEIGVIIVSDTGPLSLDRHKHQMGQFRMTTSLFSSGKSLFFWKKVWLDQMNVYRFVLHEVDLGQCGYDVSANQLDAYIAPVVSNDENYQIFFAQDGESKGRQLIFNDEELEKLKNEKMDILSQQFVIIVSNQSHDDFKSINIYQMKNLEECLTVDLKINLDSLNPKSSENISCLRTKFNSFFVISHEKAATWFYCIYDHFYAIVSVEETESSKIVAIKQFVEIKKSAEAGHQQGQNRERDWRKATYAWNRYGSNILSPKDHNQDGYSMDKFHLHDQVRVLQSEYILKYDPQENSSCQSKQEEHLSYFGIEEDETHDQDLDDDNQLQDHDYYFKSYHKQQHHSNVDQMEQHVKVYYFIDPASKIQILHSHIVQNEKKQKKIDDYYRLHIMTKIGMQISGVNSQVQIKAAYIKNKMTYEDIKFAGLGLAECFICADQTFSNRAQQCKFSNFVVAQTGQDQFLYVYKQHNLSSHDYYGQNQDIEHYNIDFDFDIIKMRQKSPGEAVSQHKQIHEMLNSHSMNRVVQIPQIRINGKYRDVMSSWWAINLQQDNTHDTVFDDGQIDLLQFEMKDLDANQLSNIQNELVESTSPYMIFETPQGKYFRMKIIESDELKELEENHRNQERDKTVKFFFVPVTYIMLYKVYYVIIELRVLYNNQFFFTAEIILIEFDVKDEYDDYNTDFFARQCLLDKDSYIKYFINPDDPKDTTDDQVKKNELKIGFTKSQKLSKYNFYASRFFQRVQASEDKNDNKKLLFKDNQSQTIFKFEKIIDSKAPIKFIPFMSYKKQIIPIGEQDSAGCVFNNFCVQCLHFAKSFDDQDLSSIYEKIKPDVEKIHVTPSVVFNPKLKERQTIKMDNQIQFWRCSDYFKKEDGTILAHYRQTLIFGMLVERMQVFEFVLSFDQSQRKAWVNPIAKNEKLISSIATLNQQQNLRMISKQIQHLESNSLQSMERDKNLEDLNQKLEQLIENNELKAAKAAEIPYFDDSGDAKCSNGYERGMNLFNGQLQPFKQSYKSPFLIFGYEKTEINPRQFELKLHTRLPTECILNDIFSKYEVYHLFDQMTRQLLQMKPVVLQDFDFLLLHTCQTYEFQSQMNESFFMQQELYQGQTMCDINLNDSNLIQLQIIQFRNTYGNNCCDRKLVNSDVLPYIKGSLFDMLLQNNPYSTQMKENICLGIEHYLIVSKDFNFKSQLMRALEINALNSYKILFENINEINQYRYAEILEHDLFQFMFKDNIQEIFKFFEFSKQEEMLEMDNNQNNVFCNFEQLLNNDKIPTIWTQDETNYSMYHLRDAQNEVDEIVNRLCNIAEGFETDNTFQCKHKLVDFQKVTFGEKIKRILEFVEKEQGSESLKGFNYTFNDLKLAEMMLQEEDSNREFYQFDTAQLIVDAQFEQSSRFFLRLFIFYLVTFILPMSIAFFVESKEIRFTCLIISMASLLMFFIIELCQIKSLGFVTYLSDPWNLVDSSQFFVFFGLSYYYLQSSGVDSVQDKHDHEDGSVLLVYFQIIALAQAFFKAQSFIRIFDDYGFLVRMLSVTVKELVPFMVFFFVYTLFFAMSYHIAQVEIDTTEPCENVIIDGELVVDCAETFSAVGTAQPEKVKPQSKRSASPLYPGLNKDFGHLLYSFRNSIGDLATPNYDFWILKQQKSNAMINVLNFLGGEPREVGISDQNAIIALVWTIWLIQAMIMVIIMLNYLIAVISSAYERVVMQREIYQYTHKAEINLDYFQIISQLRRNNLQSIKQIVFVQSSTMQMYGDSDNWFGIVNAIKKHMNIKDQNIKDKFSSTQEQISNVHDQVTQIEQEQKEMKILLKTILRKV